MKRSLKTIIFGNLVLIASFGTRCAIAKNLNFFGDYKGIASRQISIRL
jgi:hypothetical protein